MKEKIDDFNVVITEIIIAHRCTFDLSSVYTCSGGRKKYGLVYLLTGKLEFRFSDGRFLQASAGDLLLLKPSDEYTVTCPSVCEHYTVNFDILPASVSGKIAKKAFHDRDTAVVRQGGLGSVQTDTLEQLCEVWKKKAAGYQMQAYAFVYKLLHHFIKKQLPLYQNEHYEKLKPAIHLLETAWNEKLTLSALADACHLSVAHFRHLFTAAFEMSPMEYRDSLRLLYAKDYLMREGYSITEIAYKCGFDDVNYFCRFFKKHLGVSPSKYLSE